MFRKKTMLFIDKHQWKRQKLIVVREWTSKYDMMEGYNNI